MKLFRQSATTTNDGANREPLSQMDRILRCQPKICYIIAIVDLIQALFFTVEATKVILSMFDLYTSLALLGTIIWILSDVLFIAGLWKCRPGYLKLWLAFSLIGCIADTVYLLKSIITTTMMDWTKIMQFTLLYLGIVFEFFCFYLVYKYYLIMDPCCLIIIEDGKKCPLDDVTQNQNKKRDKKKEKKHRKETANNNNDNGKK